MFVTPACALSNETSPSNNALPNNETYGGIQGNVSQPPEGTQINLLLSRYYQLPVATEKGTTFWYGLTYWHVGGYWFTAKELMKLPYDYIKKNRSPYYGGIIDDDMQNVPVPVSWITLAGFACFAIVINKKR